MTVPTPRDICHIETTVSQDVPGFVSNALLMPFINEVCHLSGFLHRGTDLVYVHPVLGDYVAREGKSLDSVARLDAWLIDVPDSFAYHNRVSLLGMILTRRSN